MDIETDNVFDTAPKHTIAWEFPKVDIYRAYDDDGQGGSGVHTQSTIYVKVLPHQEAELLVILEEWMGQRL